MAYPAREISEEGIESAETSQALKEFIWRERQSREDRVSIWWVSIEMVMIFLILVLLLIQVVFSGPKNRHPPESAWYHHALPLFNIRSAALPLNQFILHRTEEAFRRRPQRQRFSLNGLPCHNVACESAHGSHRHAEFANSRRGTPRSCSIRTGVKRLVLIEAKMPIGPPSDESDGPECRRSKWITQDQYRLSSPFDSWKTPSPTAAYPTSSVPPQDHPHSRARVEL